MIKYFKMCSLRFDVHEEFTVKEMLDLIKSRYPKFLSATACRYASLSQETSTVNDSCSGTRTWDKQGGSNQ